MLSDVAFVFGALTDLNPGVIFEELRNECGALDGVDFVFRDDRREPGLKGFLAYGFA